MDRDLTLLIDPFTHRFERDRMFDLGKDPKNGANILSPWVYLRGWFQSRGVKVHTADRYLRGELRASRYVYLSFGLRNRYRALARRRDVLLSAFFAFESPIVEPSLYTDLHTVQKYFKRVFTFTDSQALAPFLRHPVCSQVFRIPCSGDTVNETLWSQQNRKFLVMMNHNKLPPIFWNELFTERMRAVEYFAHWGEIDLYGLGWDGPPFLIRTTWLPGTLQRMERSLLTRWQRLRPVPLLQAARRVYRGSVPSKPETMARYNFALCFENVVLSGWVTEKIFDCLVTGTVPIYWGASDIGNFVPPDCFIDMRHFSGYRELRSYLKSLGRREIQQYKENGRAYLSTAQFRPFTREFFTALVARIVEEDTGVALNCP